jgi:uncharacterized damage-inducible protein DinB
MQLDEMRRICEANDAIWEGWWPLLISLNKAQVYQELMGSFPHVFATTAHMVIPESVWQRRLEAEPDLNDPTSSETMMAPPRSLKPGNASFI